ncbi:ABC transporter permease [Brevibacillus laterosporus]|uniref:Multidrug ABC transporter permease n=2 Tax=Brevibacillus TaxID=55080 RepID=A0A0F7C106_BRELA|nr:MULTISPECIES: ABC transporter permease [Brevibacillus]AKF95113.1 multidrug ABC transporter permease [Brevibacillus laterosporus]MCR8985432.1 ABC transporter permease [Brevibacillus laterosporus]MCZ0831165.1 ABC transporter permease [Brevibacillus halotolerans]GIN99922.1 ABC transporter [Brevibacillus halotolerans]
MNSFLQLVADEWRSIYTNKTIRNIVFLVPCVYMLMFGYLYQEKRVMEIPTVVADLDQTELTRELIRAIDNDQTFSVTNVVTTEEELQHLMTYEEAQVGFIIPKGLTVNAKLGKPTEILNLIDGSNMMISNTSVRAASSLVKTISGGVTLKKLEAKGEWGSAATNFATGIDYRYRILHNPAFNYLAFMIFGLAGTVLQQVAFLSVSLSVTRQKEEGTWMDTLNGNGFVKIALSKITTHMILAMFNFLLTYVLIFKFFAVTYYGSLSLLFLSGFIFNLAVVSIGFAISFFSSNMLQATQTAMLIAVPSFMLSGWTWPITSMPTAIAIIAKSLPLTYFLHSVREIISKGHGWEFVSTDNLILLFMIVVALFVAFVTYMYQKKYTRKNYQSNSETVL